MSTNCAKPFLHLRFSAFLGVSDAFTELMIYMAHIFHKDLLDELKLYGCRYVYSTGTLRGKFIFVYEDYAISNLRIVHKPTYLYLFMRFSVLCPTGYLLSNRKLIYTQ